MKIGFRNYEKEDVLLLKDMWNEVIEDGMSFPQIEPYDTESFSKVREEETAVVCMCVDGEIAGYYTLHPNIIGRCSHVANISYLIGKKFRGRHLGRHLVADSVRRARQEGFRGIQFNGVGAWNKAAIHLYQDAGFKTLATIPGGFRLKDGTYSDMYIMYLSLIE